MTTVDQTAQRQLVQISQWLDDSQAHLHPDVVRWVRMAKVAEEAGEVIEALIGYTGTNPRKGVCRTEDDIRRELLDVVLTGLAAYEHLNGNDGSSLEALRLFIAHIHARAGLSSALDQLAHS